MVNWKFTLMGILTNGNLDFSFSNSYGISNRNRGYQNAQLLSGVKSKSQSSLWEVSIRVAQEENFRLKLKPHPTPTCKLLSTDRKMCEAISMLFPETMSETSQNHCRFLCVLHLSLCSWWERSRLSTFYTNPLFARPVDAKTLGYSQLFTLKCKYQDNQSPQKWTYF